MASEAVPNPETSDMGTSGLPGRAALDIAEVRSLSHRSNLQGLLRFATHLLVMALTGTLVWFALPHWYWLIPAMVLHGFTLVSMFAPMHECVHRTAFANRTLNEIFGWIAGLLSFYNFTYYRYYHTWHHRYTQDPDKDPELMTPKPRNLFEYALEIIGVRFWFPRLPLFLRLATGRTARYPFIPENARGRVAVSAVVQISVYVGCAVLCFQGITFPLYFFFLPALVAQPLLRLILITEHTGCSQDENGLTNTRTTLASFPIRLLMWNMPFHAEHHLYPSIPFHDLPRAHRLLREKLQHVAPSYAATNREIVSALSHRSH